MSVSKRLITQYATFPQRCLHCGGPFEVMVTISAFKGLDVGFASGGTVAQLQLPACRHCRNRRWLISAVRHLLALLLVFVVFLVPFIAFEQPGFNPGALIGFAGVFFMMYWWRRRSGGWVDWLTLGVWATKLTLEPPTMTLFFVDERLADEVELLTEECRQTNIQAAKAYLSQRIGK